METDDNKTDNRLREPEAVYGRLPRTDAIPSRKTVEEMMEIIRREHPRLYAKIPDLRERLEALEHPRPCTVEELRARIDGIQARIDAGDDRGISLEEFQAEMEEEFPELKRRYLCDRHPFPSWEGVGGVLRYTGISFERGCVETN